MRQIKLFEYHINHDDRYRPTSSTRQHDRGSQ